MRTLHICLLLCLAFSLNPLTPSVSASTSDVASPHWEATEHHQGEATFPTPHISTTLSSGERAISSYMIGSIALQVIFVESSISSGTATEDWQPDQIQAISKQVQSALDWWKDQMPLAKLEFLLEISVAEVQTEPITLGVQEERLWIQEAFTKKGFTQSNHFEQAYASANALREKYAANWASTIFIVNSSNDEDGRFSDGLFAYAYVQGPFMVLTSKAGNYGETQLAPVIAHELAHIFGALDQYEAAQVPCSQRSGYLYTHTSNSQWQKCGSNKPSIMIDPVSAFHSGHLDDSARAQLGYVDQNNNGVLDLIDTIPKLAISMYKDTQNGYPQLWIIATEQGFPSPIAPQISINTISRIELRIDQGEWLVLAPNDGAYDSAQEQLMFTLPLYQNQKTVEIRAINSIGNSSPVWGKTLEHHSSNAAPVFEVALPERSNTRDIELQLKAPSDSMYQISTDISFADAPWQPSDESSGWQLPNRDGIYEVFVRFRDNKGIESLIFRRILTLDRQAPNGVVTVSSLAPASLTLDVADTLSELQSITLVLVDRQITLEYQAEVQLDSDIHKLQQILVTDAAGNQSSPLPIHYRMFLSLTQG